MNESTSSKCSLFSLQLLSPPSPQLTNSNLKLQPDRQPPSCCPLSALFRASNKILRYCNKTIRYAKVRTKAARVPVPACHQHANIPHGRSRFEQDFVALSLFVLRAHGLLGHGLCTLDAIINLSLLGLFPFPLYSTSIIIHLPSDISMDESSLPSST